MKFIDIPFVPFEDFKMPPFTMCGIKANIAFENGYNVSIIMTNMEEMQQKKEKHVLSSISFVYPL